ncbi:hypothetical protein MNV49_001619 [Pseudohyphozyma bogoriensis]|nr:hypothetical protein MNV49_001619 [Pseudohyphozyma bogoriensis]
MSDFDETKKEEGGAHVSEVYAKDLHAVESGGDVYGIGVGLFVGSGAALSKAGPAGLLMAFIITGFILWGVMNAAGEQATMFPSSGTFPSFSSRFLDKSLGFTLGWNYWYSYSISIATELTAAAIVVSYWSSLSSAIWISIGLVLMVLCVRYYGEAEIVTSSIKVLTFVGLIILGIVLDLGGGPTHDRIGFRYWNNPGAFNEYPGVGGALGRFLAFFSAFINSSFTYQGTECVVLAAGEASNPTKQIPKAVRRVMYRIMFFYVVGILIIGMLVPYTNENLLSGTGNAASSPFVIAIENAGIKGLPSLINACILTSAWSAGNTYIYTSSRTLYALAVTGQAPRFLLRTSKNGNPYLCVGITACFGLLAYLSVGSGGSEAAFTWLQNMTTVAGLLCWANICWSYIGMHKALKAQGVDRNTLPFKAPFQPYLSYFSMIACLVITFFSGFGVFIKGNWNTSDFIASYIGIPIYILPAVIYKLVKKSKWVDPATADLVTGKINPEDEEEDPPATTWGGKFLDLFS